MRRLLHPVSLVALLLCPFDQPIAADMSGKVGLEGRWFGNEALGSAQQQSGLSLTFEPELYHDWSEGDERFVVVPFLRYDGSDEDRTHVDLRELYWRRSFASADLYVGLRKVFWGVTESVHLVDIINQTDWVENPDAEDKLGQPMIQLTLLRDWGTVDLYLMAGFRPRTFAGVEGRFRPPLPVKDQPRYEADLERWHPDVALRWSHILGDIDLGVGHFYGSSREPRFDLEASAHGAKLRPIYDLLHQTSLELQYVRGDGLYKLEAVHRDGYDGRSTAAVGGLEYTFVGLASTSVDFGLVAEAQYDNRDLPFPPVADRDIAIGGRLTFNDVQDTDVLAFTAMDTDQGTQFTSLEANRRWRDTGEIRLEARIFTSVDARDPLYAFRRDDYLQIEYVHYF
ncbi:MAG: hypothetical protein HN712_13400 [Gemmatimonadetes bacterium]|jgi:hypothetical protein|nr:hypothetical protein [Gemmatimonadota bacterium]MBT6148390.1 hypothetical protein [Gemmatimonadota bacterium]MBT7861311.1 hypothetical protein [Gemmatimonadota bacterium]